VSELNYFLSIYKCFSKFRITVHHNIIFMIHDILIMHEILINHDHFGLYR
jgi:hypothetical protein